MTSNTMLCCPATRIPREHSSILLSVFLSALDARLRLDKPFTLLVGDIPGKSEPIIELQEIKNDNYMQPGYRIRYFMITRNLEENRAYIEMYPGESFGELELEAVEEWRMEQDQWWNMDNITNERVRWRCSSCQCSYAARILRGSE